MAELTVVKKNQDFQSIFAKGHSICGRYLVVYFLHNALIYSRFGFCVSRKLGTAVKRNRVKRRLREAAHQINSVITPGWDILLVARFPIAKAGLADIIMEIKYILIKAAIVQIPNPGVKEDSP